MKPLFKTLLTLVIGLALLACNEPETVQQNLDPVAFHDSDECHVCGMIITDFPGPFAIRPASSGQTRLTSLMPSATAWSKRLLIRMSVSFQPGNPAKLWNITGPALSEHSAPACVTGSISS